jgi:hypothetical protein
MKLRTVNPLLDSRFVYVAIGAAGGWAHLAFAIPLYEPLQRCLAAYLLWVFLFLCYRFFRDQSRTGMLRLMFTLQVYVMYGLPQFTQERLVLVSGSYVPTSNAITWCMLIVALGELAMLAGYRIVGATFRHLSVSPFRHFPAPRESWEKTVLVYGALGTVAFFVSNLERDILPIEISNLVFKILNPQLALVLVSFFAYRFQSRRCHRLRGLMVASMAFFGLISGMMENAIQPLFILIVTTTLWGPGLSLRWCAVGLVGFLIMNPVKHKYRDLAWADRDEQNKTSWADISDRINKWLIATEKTWQDPFASEHSIEATSGRTSGLLPLAQAVDWVPDNIPFKEGEGFAETLSFFIPRLLWPDKPDNTQIVNDRYAVEFRITTPSGVKSSTFGTPLPMDGYWDFGWLGAIGYMGACGVLFGWLFGSAGRKREPVEEVVEVLFCSTFLQALIGLFNMLTVLLSLTVGAWIALKLIDLISPTPRFRANVGGTGALTLAAIRAPI